VLALEDRTPQEIAKNPVLQKAVLPLVRGYARIEGSKMAGRDFVAQSAAAAAPDSNPREVLQQKLMAKVVPACAELGVAVESITIGQSEKDADLEALATQIADREQARLEREKNASLIDQYKQAQELAATTARKEQNEEKVAATTKLNVSTVEAEQKLEVEQKKLDQDLKNAETNLKAAKEQAEAVLAQAEADAEVITKENEAKVAGLRTAVEGFNSADQFAQYQMLTRLAPALKEIFASDTSDFAKLFANYMTQTPAKAPPTRAAGPVAGSAPVMPASK
jgi:chromosome segregation ATPase